MCIDIFCQKELLIVQYGNTGCGVFKRGTVLESITGWVKKVGFQQKWCLTTPTDSLGIQNSNFIFGPIFGPILGHFGAQKAEKRPKNQNC